MLIIPLSGRLKPIMGTTNKNAILISFEGLEGSGKSTLLKLFCEQLTNSKIEFICFREPGATNLGEEIRNILLQTTHPVSDLSELLLFVSARAQLIHEKLTPLLDHNIVIILDRYIDSSIAYQGYGHNLGHEYVENLHHSPGLDLFPDLTFYLDIDYPTSQNRQSKRKSKPDRIESREKEFFLKVREGYLQIAKRNPQRVRLIDATQNLEKVLSEINDNWQRFYENS